MRDTKHEIIHFWFNETDPQQWFQKSPEFDALVKERFGVTYQMAKDGLCQAWAKDAEGALALVIVLDQFPRHMFRDTPAAFETDEQALLAAKKAIASGFDQILEPVKRGFLYVPFQHSENMSDQNRSVELMSSMQYENPAGYDYAIRHRVVIEKYGRFPHRNKILGRENTPEEEEYLKQPGAGF